MKVTAIRHIKGRGHLIVVDELPGNIKPKDILVTGNGGQWRICSIELQGGRHPRIGACLALNGHVDDLPLEGNVLSLKPREVLKEKLSAITVEEFLEVWTKDQKDRVELAGVLKELNQTIDALEIGIGGTREMGLFKQMREAFNKIPPKWFHR